MYALAEKRKMSKKVKTIIAILLALLILSAGALAARVVYLNYFKDNTATVVVPDNLIGEEDSTSDTTSTPDTSKPNSDNTENTEPPSESTGTETTTPETSAPTESTGTNNGSTTNTENKAAVIELYKGQPSDNEKFQVTNMLPGDAEVKYFAVKVSHHADAIVYFNAEVTEQTKSLADVLHIKVTHLENGKEIYNGTFADMNIDGYGETFATTQKTETVAYYKIEVSLPTSTGNEYQAAKLMADFNWYVKDVGPLDSPQTGDNSNIVLYFIIMICSLAMIIILLFTKRREREVDGNAN